MNYRHDLDSLRLHLFKLQAKHHQLNNQLLALARLNVLHPSTSSAKQIRGVEKRIKHVSTLIQMQEHQQLDMFEPAPSRQNVTRDARSGAQSAGIAEVSA